MSHPRRRRNERPVKAATLNLVSLMDIFTILVFFLMVNSSDVEVLETASDLKLPDSVSEQRPEERITITISDVSLIVQGREVATIADVLASELPLIEGLSQELNYQAQRKSVDMDVFEGAVTILGDQKLPYEVLKRVMYTCQQSSYTRIALGVNRLEKSGGEA